MTSISPILFRGRARTASAMLIVAGAAICTVLWPLYRNWMSQLDQSLAQTAGEVEYTQRLIARTGAFADSLPAWRKRATPLRNSRVGSLDAIQRSGIRELRTLADSAGVSTEAIVADRYTARAIEACREAACMRVVTLRGTFSGDTESALDLITFLEDSTKRFIIRELSLQPQTTSGPITASSHLRIEATIGVAGVTTAHRPE